MHRAFIPNTSKISNVPRYSVVPDKSIQDPVEAKKVSSEGICSIPEEIRISPVH